MRVIPYLLDESNVVQRELAFSIIGTKRLTVLKIPAPYRRRKSGHPQGPARGCLPSGSRFRAVFAGTIIPSIAPRTCFTSFIRLRSGDAAYLDRTLLYCHYHIMTYSSICNALAVNFGAGPFLLQMKGGSNAVSAQQGKVPLPIDCDGRGPAARPEK